MTREEAAKRMFDFATKYRGQSVMFMGLDDDSRFDYVLVKSYSYYRKFQNRVKSIDRAIANTEAQQRNGFTVFEDETEHMVISQ